MRQYLERMAPYFPIAGGVFIVIGLITYFIRGRFDLTVNALIGGGAILALLFVVLRPNDVRALLSGRTARYGTSTVLSVVLFTAVAILLYWVTYQNDAWRIDTTETQSFTPAQEIVDLLNQVDEPIEALAFYTPGSPFRANARQVLDNLEAASDNFTYEFIDPESSPLIAEQYDLTTNSTTVFVANRGEPDERFTELFDVSNERNIYAALLELITATEKKAYYLSGHGEPEIDDVTQAGFGDAMQRLDDLGFEVEALDLRVAGTIPDDAAAVILLGQRAPLQASEVEALDTYVKNGGAAFIAREALLDQDLLRVDQDGLQAWLADTWGLQLRDNVVIEPALALANQQVPVMFVTADFGSSAITIGDVEEFGLLFATARSIEAATIEGVSQTELVRTTAEAWGETDREAFPPERNAADVEGPLLLAVSAENSETGGRVVVVGDTDFLRNQLVDQAANDLFFTNALNWLARDEQTLELTPREVVDRQLTVTAEQVALLQVLAICVGPLVILLIGAAAWQSRRS